MSDLNEILQLKNNESMAMPEDFTPNGWVYILANESMPGVYKVGMTNVNPEKRAKDLSSASGVPTPFIVMDAYRSTSPCEDEKAVHQMLSRYRVNQGREFFKVDLATIEEACEKVMPFGNTTQVEDLTEYFNLITLDTPCRNEAWEFIDSWGINSYGGKNDAAIALVYLGALVVKEVTKNGGSIVIYDNGIRLLGADEVPV